MLKEIKLLFQKIKEERLHLVLTLIYYISQLKEKFCLDLDLKSFKAKQIWNWIYCFGKTSFQEMTNLDKNTRKVVLKQKSDDGSIGKICNN